MTAYDAKTLEKVLINAHRKGCKDIDIILAKYEERLLLSDMVFHHHILLKVGKKVISVYDYASTKNYEERAEDAEEDVRSVINYFLDAGMHTTFQRRKVEYSWWRDKPVIPQSNK